MTAASRSIRRHVLMGVGVAGLIVVGFGGWAANAMLSGAVVGSGMVVVDGNSKTVQHKDGGIVGAIHVRDGDKVEAGQLLVRLDDTLTRANLAIIEKQIDALSAGRMRLVAERDDNASLAVPEELATRQALPTVAELIRSEQSLFVARQKTLAGQKDQLRQRVSQLADQIKGFDARLDGKDQELALIDEELKGVSGLHKNGLVPITRLIALKREKARLVGERGQLLSDAAATKTRITETELQILQLDADRRAEVMTELRDTDAKLSELTERRIAALDQLNRIDIRSPQSGIVHALAVHTIGGVIAPGDAIMMVVPNHEKLVIEARLQPMDIDQVRIGQEAHLRFSAFNQRTTPELIGSVKTVAADLTRDTTTGESWYIARIAVTPDELAKLGKVALVPGMPVEAFIQTGERTAASYFLKPLADQVSRAFREE